MNRLILVKRLVKCGHKVVTAEHGGDAVRLLEQELDGFDLVLMDLMMPVRHFSRHGPVFILNVIVLDPDYEWV